MGSLYLGPYLISVTMHRVLPFIYVAGLVSPDPWHLDQATSWQTDRHVEARVAGGLCLPRKCMDETYFRVFWQIIISRSWIYLILSRSMSVTLKIMASGWNLMCVSKRYSRWYLQVGEIKLQLTLELNKFDRSSPKRTCSVHHQFIYSVLSLER